MQIGITPVDVKIFFARQSERNPKRDKAATVRPREVFAVQKTQSGLSRRVALQNAAASAGFSAFAGLPAQVLAAAASSKIAGYVPGNVVPAATLGDWLKTLHDFGPIRATGTPQCRAFEEFLAAEFSKLGCTVLRDQFKLTSWECDIPADCEIARCIADVRAWHASEPDWRVTRQKIVDRRDELSG